MQHREWSRKAHMAWLLILVNVLVGIAFVSFRQGGCSVERKGEVAGPPVAPEPTPPPAADDGGDEGGEPEPPPRKACSSVVTFDELQPVIATNCTSCHQGFDTLETAGSKIDAYVKRIVIPARDPGHMPAGRGDLARADIDLFKGWKADGKLAASDCEGDTAGGGGGGQRKFYDFAWLEDQMTAETNRVPASERDNIRFLVAIDALNLGRTEDLAVAKAAAVKSTNSISTERELYPVIEVAPGLWRIDIEELGLEAADWTAIEDASQLQFESFTGAGTALKAATQSRLPWMFIQDFNDVALRNGPIYYQLTKAPATLQELKAKLEVDFADDLADFSAALVGFNGSPLSPAANRLMSRHDSEEGFFWATYDTGPIISAEQDLSRNPLLPEAGGQANLQFAAGEQLYSLPNGLMASYLSDAQGVRLNFADPNVVHDFTANPNSPIIRNAISCFRCHSGGLLVAKDQVRASLASGQVAAADAQRALALYKPQREIDALFAKDNKRFKSAMDDLGLDVAAPDPISRVSDRFLGDLQFEDVAALAILPEAEFKECLGLSQAGTQLLNNGNISHDQLMLIIGQIKTDCRLFQEPL